MPATASGKRLVIIAGVLSVVAITAFAMLQLWPAGDTTEPAADPAAANEDVPARRLTATEVADRFLAAFTSGRTDEAAALTDNPPAAAAQLTQVRRTLAPVGATASRTQPVNPGADVPFTISWTLAGGRGWEYQSALRTVEAAAGWRVQWQPTLVHPRLAAGQSLALRDQTGQPAVLDRDGSPLLVWSPSGVTAADGGGAAPPLLPAMRRLAEGRPGTAGWSVVLVDAAGTELGVVDGVQQGALTSTVSVPVQKAAQAAVDAEQRPAMLVVMQPSTGDILAVAQNAAAGGEPVALNGLYPPGSTFKIATATALVEAGAGVDTVVPCPGSVTVGQRTVRNSAGFALGDVPLREAFAASCNTSFAARAADLSLDALPEAANQLGLGADFTIPDISTEAGSVPSAPDRTRQVENSIGQGQVQASCFGVTLMSATVAAGNAVTPTLWRDLDTTVNTGYDAPPAPVIGALRTMMRSVVTSGTATELAGHGKVHGKTGTAQTAGGGAHGWFTGYRGDLAFTALVLEGESSKSAVAVTGSFLRGLG